VDTLVFTTDRFQFVALRYDDAARSLRTIASGELRDSIGHPCDAGTRLRVAPTGTLIALHMYDAMLKVRAYRHGDWRDEITPHTHMPRDHSSHGPRSLRADGGA